MNKKSRLKRLVCEYLPMAIVLIEFVNQVVDLVSKAVNYGLRTKELRVLVP